MTSCLTRLHLLLALLGGILTSRSALAHPSLSWTCDHDSQPHVLDVPSPQVYSQVDAGCVQRGGPPALWLGPLPALALLSLR